MFGGDSTQPLKHLGEAQTCYAIRHLTEARKALVKVSADGKKPGAVISDTGAAVFGVAGTVVVLAAAGIALTIWRKRRI